jgi:hypothetical protein
MTDCRRLSLLAYYLGPNKKQVVPKWVGGCQKDRFKGNGNFLRGVKREVLNRLVWRRSVHSCWTRRLSAALIC